MDDLNAFLNIFPFCLYLLSPKFEIPNLCTWNLQSELSPNHRMPINYCPLLSSLEPIELVEEWEVAPQPTMTSTRRYRNLNRIQSAGMFLFLL